MGLHLNQEQVLKTITSYLPYIITYNSYIVYVSDILNVFSVFFFQEWKIKRKIHFDIFEIAIGETTNYANFYKVFFSVV